MNDCVHAASKLQWPNKSELEGAITVSGEGPKPTTGPPDVPSRTVTYPDCEVKVYEFPAVMPKTGENSPAKLQVLMVTGTPTAPAVADPNCEK